MSIRRTRTRIPAGVPQVQGLSFTQLVNLDGSTLTGTTTDTGSWSVSGGKILVSPGLAFARLRQDTTVDYLALATVVEAKVLMKSTGSHAGTNRIGIKCFWDGVDSGGVEYALDSSGLTPASNGRNYSESPEGITVTQSDSVRFNLDQEYTLRMVWKGTVVSCYRDGVLALEVHPITNDLITNPLYSGLVAYNCDAQFDDFKVWQTELDPALP
jgi:hypothetical protein